MSRYASEVNEFLHGMQKGSKSAFTELFHLTANHLRSVAKHYLHDPSLYDDVVLDAYFRAWCSIETFDVQQDGYNWLCKIVEHVAYGYNIKEDKERQKAVLYAQRIREKEEDAFAYAEIRLDVKSALRRLEQQSRKMLYAHFWHGISYGAIGRHLGLSKSAVEKRIQKSLQILKEILQKE